jgi:hypothetical protein
VSCRTRCDMRWKTALNCHLDDNWTRLEFQFALLIFHISNASVTSDAIYQQPPAELIWRTPILEIIGPSRHCLYVAQITSSRHLSHVSENKLHERQFLYVLVVRTFCLSNIIPRPIRIPGLFSCVRPTSASYWTWLSVNCSLQGFWTHRGGSL